MRILPAQKLKKLLSSFDGLGGEKRNEAVLMLVMHYLDDIVVNPNKIDPKISEEDGIKRNVLNRRMQQNRKNPAYID